MQLEMTADAGEVQLGRRAPVVPESTEGTVGALEIVFDPGLKMGSIDMAPDAVLLSLQHPRHGWLNFLLPAKLAKVLAEGLNR